jgi:hypothetical protein
MDDTESADAGDDDERDHRVSNLLLDGLHISNYPREDG